MKYSIDTGSHTTVIAVIVTLYGFFFFVALYFGIISIFYSRKNSPNRNRIFILTQTFFDSILPTELCGQIWTVRFFGVCLQQHQWLRLFFSKSDYVLFPELLNVTVQTTNYAVVCSVLVYYWFDHDKDCQILNNNVDCTLFTDSSHPWAPVSYGCSWHVAENKCLAAPPSPVSKAILVAMVLVLSCPLNRLTAWISLPFGVLCSRLALRDKAAALALSRDTNSSDGEIEDVLEFGCLQSLKSTFMRAASLETMRQRIDNVGLATESISIINDVLGLDGSLNLNQSDNIEREIDYQALQSIKMVDKKDDIAATLRLAQLDELLTRDVSSGIFKNKIVKSYRMHVIVASRHLRKKRQEAFNILSYLQSPHLTDYERNVYLIQKFILGQLSEYNQRHAEQFFVLDDKANMAVTSLDICLQYLSPAILLAYIGVTLRYILGWGSTFNRESTSEIWLHGFLLSLWYSMLFLSTFGFLFHRIIIPSLRNFRLRAIHGVLRERANSIMKRKFHYMSLYASLVQHFNPACRAARMYPTLPASRLLMSLSDFDLPDSLIRRHPPVVISPTIDAWIRHFSRYCELRIPFQIAFLFTDLAIAVCFSVLMLAITILWHQASAPAAIAISAVLCISAIYLVLFRRYKVDSHTSRVLHPVDSELKQSIMLYRQGDTVAGTLHESGAMELLNRGRYRRYWYTDPNRSAKVRPDNAVSPTPGSIPIPEMERDSVKDAETNNTDQIVQDRVKRLAGYQIPKVRHSPPKIAPNSPPPAQTQATDQQSTSPVSPKSEPTTSPQSNPLPTIDPSPLLSLLPKPTFIAANRHSSDTQHQLVSFPRSPESDMQV